MPELPEVEVVRAGLAEHVVGRTIAVVDVLHPRPVRRHGYGSEDFAARLSGRTVLAARRRGKYLWLPLDDGAAVVAHLGMSGQFLIRPPDAPAEPHLRIRFTLDDPEAEMRFVDQRMFGGVWVSTAGAEAPPEMAHIARDPIDPGFDDERFLSRLRRSRSAVKRQLLDQRLVSGIGNIYADEALWLAMLHGERAGHRLRQAQAVELLAAVRTVLTAALGQGGTSFDALYVNVNGESGYFERSLEVYGREGRPCRRCGTAVVRVPFMNRSSFFCPVCQPRPRRARQGPPAARLGKH